MKTTLRNFVFAALLVTLCGCGAKGPLFLPEEAAPVELPAESGEAAPAESDAVEPNPADSDEADAPPTDAVPAASTPPDLDG